MNGPRPSEESFVVRAFWRCLCGRTLSFKTDFCAACDGARPLTIESPLIVEQLDQLPPLVLASLKERL